MTYLVKVNRFLTRFNCFKYNKKIFFGLLALTLVEPAWTVLTFSIKLNEGTKINLAPSLNYNMF